MQDSIVERINSLVVEYEKNNKIIKLWREPIIEFISAENENLQNLKEIVCSDHLMPYDILPDAKSIISYFIPFNENIVKSNINGLMASTEWVIAYIKTNNLIRIINENIVELMKQNGYKAATISVMHPFDLKKLVSTWSHRHIAYIAGMGTFGMNNMLITKNGCCGRFGSIIINYGLSEYKQIGDIKEKCLYKINGSCGVCQSSCVVKCYGNKRFDREKCYEQCLKNREHHKKYGQAETAVPHDCGADVCGKCLVNLPCSMKEPEAPSL
jgi:epoxyqueuosine reductase QueG